MLGFQKVLQLEDKSHMSARDGFCFARVTCFWVTVEVSRRFGGTLWKRNSYRKLSLWKENR